MDISKLNAILGGYRLQFEKYLNLLLKWNKTYNLTAITDPGEIWERHFLDSLTPLPFLPETGSLLDIGTGAGFPGIPIKIVRPALSVTLLEATQKKCNFCEAVVRELGLKDIRVIHGRAEDRKLQETLGLFDVVVSRATLSLKKLTLYCQPFLKHNPPSPPFSARGGSAFGGSKGGLGGIYNQPIIIAMKGEDVDKEIKKIEGVSIKYELYRLPSSPAKRNIVIVSFQ